MNVSGNSHTRQIQSGQQMSTGSAAGQEYKLTGWSPRKHQMKSKLSGRTSRPTGLGRRPIRRGGLDSRKIQRSILNVTQSIGRLMGKASRFSPPLISPLLRFIQVAVALTPAVYYRSPEVIRDTINLGGIFGKIAQMQPELSNLMGHNQESNYSKGDNERVRLALASANSQYQGGEITSEEVVRILKASLAQSQGESAEGVNIHHIKVLGRGTIAQIDHVRINDKDYAVKTLSPRLVWAMKSDAGLARGALLLAKCWGKISETDLDALSRDIEKIIQETDLSIELQNTRRQTDIFNKPSTDGGYHLEFYREVNMKECFTVPVKFKVPRVYPDLSSTNSLVMEIIDGFSLDRNEEINNMLLSWKPDWNDNKPFTPPQIAMFTYSVKSLVMEVYLEAARENEFINADFQLGNFMMKLEENKVVVYCIDHGHCISVRSPSPTAKSLHYALIKTLVNFFHSRCRIAEDIARDAVGSGDVSMNPLALIEELAGHEQQDGKAEAIHVTLKSKEAVRIRELTYSPLSYNDIQHIESTIENYEILGKNFIPSVDDDIEWCKSTRSVEEVCHKLYDWLKSDWVQSERSGNERAFPCKDDFVNRLIPTLFKVAFELKEFDKLDFETQFERSGIPFDDFVHGMGLSFPGGDLALVRLTLLVEEFNYARLKLAFG